MRRRTERRGAACVAGRSSRRRWCRRPRARRPARRCRRTRRRRAPAAVATLAHGGSATPATATRGRWRGSRASSTSARGASVPCVENFTVDFYLRVASATSPTPIPGVSCPADPYDMDLRAEIWQYTPQTGRGSGSTGRPPTSRTRARRASSSPRDIAFRGMARLPRRPRGASALYAGGVTADEYIPELGASTRPGCCDDRRQPLRGGAGARRRSCGSPTGTSARSASARCGSGTGRMYVTLTAGLTGDGEIYEVTRPWSPAGARFRQITPSAGGVRDRDLEGRAVRRDGRPRRRATASTDDRDKAPATFEPIVTGGRRPRRGPRQWSRCTSTAAGSTSAPAAGTTTTSRVSELIRIDPTGALGGGGRQPARRVDGQLKAPLSGLGGRLRQHLPGPLLAMGRPTTGALVRRHQRLELDAADPTRGSTVSSTCSVPPDRGVRLRPVGQLRRHLGARSRASLRTPTWYNFGARNLVTGPGGLFVGSANHAQGTNFRYWLDRLPRRDDRPPRDAAAAPGRCCRRAARRERDVVAGAGPRARLRVLRART